MNAPDEEDDPEPQRIAQAGLPGPTLFYVAQAPREAPGRTDDPQAPAIQERPAEAVERQPPVVAPQRKRPKRYHPTADCLGATRRLIRKLGERIARREVDGVGTDDLGALLELEGLVQDVAAQVVDRLREDGWSDGEIAEAARLRTKQAVQKRWPRRKEQA